MTSHRFAPPTPVRRSFILLGSFGLAGTVPTAALADPVVPAALAPVPVAVPPPVPRVSATPRVTPLVLEPDMAAFAAGSSPYGSKAVSPAAGQTLSAPVTVNANTSADALTVTQTGGGRAINGAVTGASNTLSAVKGITAGSGSGVNGVNSGTAGPAGKFQITATGSTQPGLVSTTTGTGNAVQGLITSTANNDAAAVLGQHNATDGHGIGVEGDGGYIGVRAVGANGYGVYASASNGYGIYGVSDGGIGIYGNAGTSAGVYGNSTSNAGIFGTSYTGNGVTGITSTASGNAAYGVYGQGDSTYGVVGISANGTGMSARSTNGYALTAVSNNAIGVYAYSGSSSSYAGYFVGPLRTTSTMTAQSYATTSDRNEKRALEAVDSAAVLEQVAALPIGAWDYKDKPGIHHIGPMAQDFRAAFGLGMDDTHIDLVDSVGVSLVAIQALRQQLKDRDARIAALEARAARAEAAEATVGALAARLAAVEFAQATTAAATLAGPP